MNKDIFIKELRECLLEAGINQSEVIDTCNYYEEYFRTQLDAGRTQQSVLDELGEPRFIARTIIDTSNKKDGNFQYSRTENTWTDQQEHLYNKKKRRFWNKEANSSKVKYESGAGTRVFSIRNKFIGILILALIVLTFIVITTIALKVLIFVLPFIIIGGIIYSFLK